MKPVRLALGVSLLALLLGACAATPPRTAKEKAADTLANYDFEEGYLECTREYPIGTNIPVKRCRTKERIDQDRDSAQGALKRIQSGNGDPGRLQKPGAARLE